MKNVKKIVTYINTSFYFSKLACAEFSKHLRKIMCISGNYESKRQRKPTKKLLESNDLDPGFMPKKGDLGLSRKVSYFCQM